MQLIEIESAAHLDQILQEQDTVLVDFSAPWCGPCKALVPLLEQISENYKDRMTFVKVDIEKCSELAQQYGIRAVPSMLIFKNNEKVGAKTGMVMKDALCKWIEDIV